ncbi:MAG TPA: hypothetical protein VH640_09490 [Bryobacteraceae bacterium]|jgi:hypothetical protein
MRNPFRMVRLPLLTCVLFGGSLRPAAAQNPLSVLTTHESGDGCVPNLADCSKKQTDPADYKNSNLCNSKDGTNYKNAAAARPAAVPQLPTEESPNVTGEGIDG